MNLEEEVLYENDPAYLEKKIRDNVNNPTERPRHVLGHALPTVPCGNEEEIQRRRIEEGPQRPRPFLRHDLRNVLYNKKSAKEEEERQKRSNAAARKRVEKDMREWVSSGADEKNELMRLLRESSRS